LLSIHTRGQCREFLIEQRLADPLKPLARIVRNNFTARSLPAPIQLFPPPNLRELLPSFRRDGYASEFAVDLPRRRLTEPQLGRVLSSPLKSRKSSSDYIVHEQYVDQAALDFHSQSVHGAHYFPRMRALFDKIDVEYFDGVVS